MNRDRNRQSDRHRFDDQPYFHGNDPQPDYFSRPQHRGPEEQDEGVEFTGTVKWFDPAKRFGFVEIPGRADGFLHANVLDNGGHEPPEPGCTITGRVRIGEKLTIVRVDSIDRSTAQAQTRAVFQAKSPRSDRRDPPIDETILASVKFYNEDKGYGFLQGPQYDVFLHVSALRRAGIETVDAGDQLEVDVGQGDRGRVAVAVRRG